LNLAGSMVTALCQHQTFIQLIYWQYVTSIIDFIVVIAMVAAVYKYIAAHIRSLKEYQTSQNFFVLSLVYCLLLIVYFIDLIINNQSYCRNETIASIAGIASYYLYNTQSLIFAFILFVRLVRIFEGTAFALPKTTVLVCAAIVLFEVCFACILYALLLFSDKWHSVWLALLALTAIIGICIIIALNVTFIRKLSLVHKSSSDENLLMIITKNSLLCFVSTSITFLCYLAFIIRFSVDSVHIMFVTELTLVCDLCTNFLCVLFTTKYFEQWYFWLCKRCHRRLIRFCSVYAMSVKRHHVTVNSQSEHPECQVSENKQ